MSRLVYRIRYSLYRFIFYSLFYLNVQCSSENLQ